MTKRLACVILSLVGYFVFAVHASAVSNVCLSGTCDINNPVYVNVYWDHSEEKWNADIAATDPTATVARIDALTEAICHSEYFAPLAQYNVQSCHTLPSIVENGCGSPPANLDKARDRIGDFASCVVSHHPDFDLNRTILNVFIPPQVAPTSKDAVFCGTFSGEHDKYNSPIGVAFLPTNSKCNGSLDAISAIMTHEMVEATTDPVPKSPSGWKGIGGEVADQCEHKDPASKKFLYGKVARYFSDQKNECVDGISSVSPFVPKITSIAACGSGGQMKITIKGDLGPIPWDLAGSGNGGSKTMFLQAQITGSHSWSAGGITNFPPDVVGWGPINWSATGDTVVIHGFDNKYPVGSVPVLEPGDLITVTVSSWRSGQSATTKVRVPHADKIKHFKVTPDVHSTLPIYVGDTPSITGDIVDAEGCSEEGLEVKPKSDTASDVFYPVKTATVGDGSFSFDYTPNGPAGTHHVTISSPVSDILPIAVHPIADSLSNTIGGVAGGQTITLKGRGFDAGNTKISFSKSSATAHATNVTVTNGHTVHFTTPPSPISNQGPGIVDVVARVNGRDSVALSYRYVVPNQPVLKFISNTCPFGGDQSINELEVNAYNADGSNAAETIALSASSAAFEDPSAHMVTTLSVAPGTTVQMKGIGPVTATPSAAPSLAVTKTYKEGPLEPGCNPAASKQFVVIDYEPQAGPVENSVINAAISQDGKSAVWVDTAVTASSNLSANGAEANVGEGDYLLLTGDGNAGQVAKELHVQTLGRSDLRSLMREYEFAVGSPEKDFKRVRFLGPNFSINATAQAAATGTIFSTPAMVSFQLTRPVTTTAYRVLYLGPGATSWVEMKTNVAITDGPQVAQAAVTKAGTYALGTVEP